MRYLANVGYIVSFVKNDTNFTDIILNLCKNILKNSFMKKSFLLLLVLVCSCMKNENTFIKESYLNEQNTFLLYQENSKGQGGYIDTLGNWVIKPKSRSFGDENFYIQKTIQIYKGNERGLMNSNGDYIFPSKYKYLRPFREGRCVFKTKDNKYGAMDTTGTEIIEAKYAAFWPFNEGLARVKLDELGKSGFINRDGDLVIPYQFEDATIFSEGIARVKKNGLWGFINTRGDWVITPQFARVGDFSNGYAEVCPKQDNCGLIDKTGKLIVDTTYFSITMFSDSLARVINTKHKLGIINLKNEIMMPMKYRLIGDLKENRAAISLEQGLEGYIDGDLNLVIPMKYKEVYNFEYGFARVYKENSEMFYINKNGKELEVSDEY